MKKKLICAVLAALLCLCMLIPLTTCTHAAPDVRELTNRNAGMFVMPFRDVEKSAWYYEPIRTCAKLGLMNGTSEDEFSPKDTVTRAMAVTVLWRLDGEPPALHVSFDDVPVKSYYAQAVAWAQREGIVNGTSKTTFSPNSYMTREQLVTILWRYGGSESGGELMFDDATSVSSWAQEAAAWAQENNIVNGSNNCFYPKNNITRAELATVIARYVGGFIHE